MPYDGFISYSHATDGRLAPAFQRGLQLLAKPWNSRRALRIFRDETGLSTNPHLWSAIEKAIDESQWFVLLASEDGAQSEWVNKEISHWLATKSVDQILPVVTDGTWEWDADIRDFTVQSSAVPVALRGALRDEPRHLDMRWARDETDLDMRNSQFRSAVADLAAPMHGVAKDELEGEDIRQHRRARRLARGAMGLVTVLMVLAVVFGVFALAQRNNARAATAVSHQELLVAESQAQLTSNRQLATLLAIEADRRQPSADTRDALMNAVLAEPRLQRTFGSPAFDLAPLVGDRVVLVSPNRGTTLNRNILQVWDWQTGVRQTWPNAPLGDATIGPLDMSATADGRLLAVISSDGMIQLYSGRTLEPQGPQFPSGLHQFPGDYATIVLSPNGQSLAVSDSAPPGVAVVPQNSAAPAPYFGRSVSVFSQVGGRWVADPPLLGERTRVDLVAFSSDGSVIATASPTPTGSEIVVDDVASGEALLSFGAAGTSSIALDWTRHRIVLSTLTGGSSDASWYDLNTPDPTPTMITVGSSYGGGQAYVGYDTTDSRLGISTTNGFGIFDAATLTPLANVPVLPTNTVAGPFLFLDSVHVLTATVGSGPIELWDLSGTSVLATRTPAQFKAIYPYIPTAMPDRFFGTSTLDNERSVSILGPGYRPLGPPIPIDQNLQELPTAVQNLIQLPLPAVMCVDPGTGHIATVSVATGDIVVRGGAPPFPVLSSAPGVAAGLVDPALCAWSPDGRQIAIGTYPQVGQPGPASVALYDVADKTLRFVEPLSGYIAVNLYFLQPRLQDPLGRRGRGQRPRRYLPIDPSGSEAPSRRCVPGSQRYLRRRQRPAPCGLLPDLGTRLRRAHAQARDPSHLGAHRVHLQSRQHPRWQWGGHQQWARMATR